MKKIKRIFVPVCFLFSWTLLMSSNFYSAPEITLPLKYVPDLMEGEDVIYEAQVSYPNIPFICYLRNHEIPRGVSGVDDRYNIMQDGKKYSFKITNVQMSDEGKVKFEFINSYGEATSSVNLDVWTRPY